VSLVLRQASQSSIGSLPSPVGFARFGVVGIWIGRAQLSYLALPGHVVGLEPAAIEGNQQVGAAVSVLHGDFGIAHLLAGRP
jgi:hypothetical protein